MFGFLFGTACLMGFFYVLRRPGFGRRCAGRGGRASRGRHFVSFLSNRLDATPAQERVLRDSVQELRAKAEEVWQSLDGSRSQVAAELRAPELDPDRVLGAWEAVDERLAELRRAAVARLAEVHSVLDPDQRDMLARLLQRETPRPFHGPYRTSARGES